MTASTITYPPIIDPDVRDEWAYYEGCNARANSAYRGVHLIPVCPTCGRLLGDSHGRATHLRNCKARHAH